MMTTRVFALIAATCFCLQGWSQTGYRWAAAGGSDGYFDTGLDVAVDGAGNVYLAGEYEDRFDFLDTLLYAQGGPDLFLAKLSPSGDLVWLNSAGSTVHDRAAAVDVGEDGSVWMAGYGKIAFPMRHTRDALLARYRSDGSLAWGKYMDGDQFSEGRDVVGDASGNATSTGVIKTMGWYGTDTIQGHGLEDAFLVRFDSSGVLQWTLAIGGPGRDEAWKVAQDPADNLIVAGLFSQTADFGGGTLSAAGGADGFVAKYSPGGALIWAKALGGPGEDEITAVEISDDGSVYFAGDFSDSIVTPVGTIRSRGALDICYGKMDPAGNLVWLKSAGGSNLQYATDLDLDPLENVYFGGFFFDSLYFDTVRVKSVAFDNLYWAKLDSNGAMRFLETALYADSRDMMGIAVDDAQNVALTGFFGQLLQLGSFTMPAVLGSIDLYVAKYATEALSVTIDSVAGSPYCGSDLFTVHLHMLGLPDAGNTFYLELSDETGSFTNPDTVGRFLGQLIHAIQGQIPTGLTGGSGYRVRVVCDSPVYVSPDNGYDITLNPATSVLVAIQGDTVICDGIPVLLYVDQGLSSQLWSNGDTNYFVYSTQPGLLWVEGTDSSGCTNRDEVTLVTCVGTVDPSDPAWFSISPNPASDEVRLRLGTGGRVVVRLFNQLGQTVLEAQDVAGTGDVNLSVADLPRGLYLLQVRSNAGTAVRRLILD